MSGYFYFYIFLFVFYKIYYKITDIYLIYFFNIPVQIGPEGLGIPFYSYKMTSPKIFFL